MVAIQINESTKCPLCGSYAYESFLGDDQRLLKCESCDVGFLSPELWIKDLETYYELNSAYAENSLDQSKIDLMEYAANDLFTCISKYVPFVKGNLLLDIGSNYGIFLECANRYGYTASGIELNKRLVEKTQSKGLNVIHGGVLDISETKHYDTITMIHVLEHIPDVKLALKKINNALKDHGLFFVEVHNADSYIAQKHKSSWKYVSLEHLYYFTPQTLSVLLREQGFEVIHIQSRNHYLETFSIKYLFQYLYATPQQKERFFKKGDIKLTAKVEDNKIPFIIIRKMIRRFLIGMIKLFHREDLMLIVAKKVTNN